MNAQPLQAAGVLAVALTDVLIGAAGTLVTLLVLVVGFFVRRELEDVRNALKAVNASNAELMVEVRLLKELRGDVTSNRRSVEGIDRRVRDLEESSRSQDRRLLLVEGEA